MIGSTSPVQMNNLLHEIIKEFKIINLIMMDLKDAKEFKTI